MNVAGSNVILYSICILSLVIGIVLAVLAVHYRKVFNDPATLAADKDSVHKRYIATVIFTVIFFLAFAVTGGIAIWHVKRHGKASLDTSFM